MKIATLETVAVVAVLSFSACSASVVHPTCVPECSAGAVCLNGACSVPASQDAGSSCLPDCSNSCQNGPDGCGGVCKVGGCKGCCDGNGQCQHGITAEACGVSGTACQACGAAGECTNGACCTPTKAPACSLAAQSNGCGVTLPANCGADGGNVVCCGGESGACCDATLCCGGACCATGQECAAGGQCCTPSCDGKCPGADDGCGHECKVTGAFIDAGCVFPLAYGGSAPCCCDTAGACLPGLEDTSCGPGLFCSNCSASGQACGLPANASFGPTGACCTPGAGCENQCPSRDPRSPNVDACGLVCPVQNTCTGCCLVVDQATVVCVAGTDPAGCGVSNGATCNVCSGTSQPTCNVVYAGGGVSATCGQCSNGATQAALCNGTCGQVQQSCQGGQWVDVGGCVNVCGAGCCSAAYGGDFTVCSGGIQVACGGGNGQCVDCTTWAVTTAAVTRTQANDYAACRNEVCCLSAGATLGNQTANPAALCCSGTYQTLVYELNGMLLDSYVCN